MEYETVTATDGERVHPGDRVRIKTYPKGTAVGVVVVSERAFVVEGGRRVPALAVNAEGTVYSMPSRPVRLKSR